MKKVLLAIPSYDGKVFTALMANILTMTQIEGVELGFVHTDGAWIIPARNEVAENAVNGGFDYIWFFDADQIPERDNLKKLLSLDKDIVSQSRSQQ